MDSSRVIFRFYSFIMLLSAVSCSDSYEYVPGLSLVPLESQDMHAYVYKKNPVDLGNGTVIQDYNLVSENEEVAMDKLILDFHVDGVLGERNMVIEDFYYEYFYSLATQKTSNEYIEYYTEAVEDINIWLLDNPPVLLNDYVCFYPLGDYSRFIFSPYGENIAEMSPELSLADYVAMHPLLTSSYSVQLGKTLPEIPPKARFILDIKLQNGKILRDTTKTISIIH